VGDPKATVAIQGPYGVNAVLTALFFFGTMQLILTGRTFRHQQLTPSILWFFTVLGTGYSTLAGAVGIEVVGALLESAAPDHDIHSVLRAHRASVLSAAGSVQSLRRGLQLSLLQCPVPPKVREAAMAAASGVPGLSQPSVDESTGVLNKMMQDARWQLDKTLSECQKIPRKYQQMAKEANADVQHLAASISFARAAVVEASSSVPQESAWFKTLAESVRWGRADCKRQLNVFRTRYFILRRDRQEASRLKKSIANKCNINSLLQEVPSAGHHGLRKARQHSKPRRLRAAASNLHSSSHQQSNPLRHRRTLLLQLRAKESVVARPDCNVKKQECSQMYNTVDRVLGEIQDEMTAVRARAAQGRRACSADEALDRREMQQASHRQTDQSQRLAQATAEMSSLGERRQKEDHSRMNFERQYAGAAHSCRLKVHQMLGQMCGLQRIRDHLWLLLGRQTLPEDCVVSDWVEGTCSKTCGRGFQVLTRQILVEPNQGIRCPPLRMVHSCGEARCPRDCRVSQWSGWSACSAECDGGLQERTRSALVEPRFGGDECPNLVDVQICNSKGCSQDCILHQWSKWSACSRACDGGTQSRHRNVETPAVRDGNCPAADAQERLEERPCNKQQCEAKEAVSCSGQPLDLVILVEASGAFTQDGFADVKTLTTELTKHYLPSGSASRVGIVAWGSRSQRVSLLTSNSAALGQTISSKLNWMQGTARLSSGLLTARRMLRRSRRGVVPTILVLTSGQLVDIRRATWASRFVRKRGIRLVFVLTGRSSGGPMLERLVTSPHAENLIPIATMEDLKANMGSHVRRIILDTCSATA